MVVCRKLLQIYIHILQNKPLHFTILNDGDKQVRLRRKKRKLQELQKLIRENVMSVKRWKEEKQD